MITECKHLDYYGILGVSRHTTPGQVAEMYELLKKHPLNQDLETQINIEMAYSVIKNPEIKAEYDKFLIEAMASQNQVPVIVNKIFTSETQPNVQNAIKSITNEVQAFLSCFLIGVGLVLVFGAASYLVQ